MAEATFNSTVVYREDLTADQCILRIAPDVGQIPEFTSGQYVELAIPTLPAETPETETLRRKFVRRAYSIASPPAIRDYVELYVALVGDGELTPKLWPQPVGGRLWLGPKIKGKFNLNPIPADRDIIMVSTGTGIAPFVSMLRTYHEHNRWKRLVIIHSARTAAELGYRLELEEFARNDPTIKYLPTLTREPAGSSWKGLRGRLQQIFAQENYAELTGAPLDPAQCHVMLCGNPSMIDAVQELLQSRGFKEHSNKEPGNIHLERYW